jgi:hypothetical protein
MMLIEVRPMRKTLVGFVILFLMLFVFLQGMVQAQTSTPTIQPSQSILKLEDGSPVRLRLQRTPSSSDAQMGDTVDFDVLQEVKVNDVLVIPKGSIAWGTVIEAQRKRRMGRGGKLSVNIDSVRLADGEKAPLRAVKGTSGGGHVGAITGAIVATSIFCFPAAFVAVDNRSAVPATI